MNYLDIIILALLVLGVISGARKGLIISILNVVSLIVTGILCFILVKPVSSLVLKYTNLSDKISSIVSERMNSLDSLTTMVIDKLKVSGMSPNEFLTASFINIAVFIVLFLLINILMSFIKQGIRASVKKSIIGPIDSLLGGVLGFFKWILILMVIFAFITPVMPLLSSKNEFYTLVEGSYIAKNFINYNFVTTVIKSFLDANVNLNNIKGLLKM